MTSIETKLLANMSLDMKNRYNNAVLLGLSFHDFEDKQNSFIFNAIKRSVEANLPHLTVGMLNEVGIDSADATRILQDLSAEPDDFTYYLSKVSVMKQDRLRRTISKTYLDKISSTDSFVEKQNLSSEMLMKLQAIDMMFVGDEEKNASEVVPLIYNAQANEQKPLSTGFPFIDKYTMGLWRGLPHIIAAESGNGKTTTLRNMATRMALGKEYGGLGYRVLVISLEMTKDLLVPQILAILNNDFMSNWYNFNFTGDEMTKKRKEAEALASTISNLYFDDANYSPEKLAQKIRQSKGKYDVILVDYFQSLDLADNMNEGQAYNRASKIITRAVKETRDIALVLLSQVTAKDGEKAKTEKQHREAKLRYSKQLLNDTAWELIVYQDERKDDEPDFDNEKNLINFFIRKNRNGEQEVHTKLPYFHSKGIIGDDWERVIPKHRMTESEYKKQEDWKKGKRPTHTFDNTPIVHLNGVELRALGFGIPEKLLSPLDKRQGIRPEIAKQFPELAKYVPVSTPEEDEIYDEVVEPIEEQKQEDGDINFEQLMSIFPHVN